VSSPLLFKRSLPADSNRQHYGARRTRTFTHPNHLDVQRIMFENFTLQELIAYLGARKPTGALRDLLNRYRVERQFPDLSNFRLGPNMFGEAALDWIIFVTSRPGQRDSELVAHGITTRISWNADPTKLPRGWMGAVRQSYEESTIRTTTPNTLVGLFIYAEAAYREHGWAAEVANAMKDLAKESHLHDFIIPLRLPTRYDMNNVSLPYEEFALQRREDGSYRDHWLRMHARLGAGVIGISPVSHQHAMHPDDLERQAGRSFSTSGTYIVQLKDEFFEAFVDLERGFSLINEGCVWVRHPLVDPAVQA
jgi:hypothetical protein